MLWIGLDDTDTLETRGTGHLARLIAAELAADGEVLGVTRHQLLDDPRVPRTAKNSCAALCVQENGRPAVDHVLERVVSIMQCNFNPGSDPGLCVTDRAPAAITAFGRLAQTQLVRQDQARALAADHHIHLLGLGGTQDGVIGALAAVGLAACGNDGRYVLIGRSRELQGLQPVEALLDAGVASVQTLTGATVERGLVQTDKLRPARRNAQAIAYVEWQGEHWAPIKLD